jgi:type IV pilus assembly protein PilQ
LRLQLGETDGKAKIIAKPKVQVMDGKTATIKNGIWVPYGSSSPQWGTNVDMVHADLMLNVTPRIFPDGRISMVVLVTDDDLGVVVNSYQTILTRQAQTTMVVKDGDTAVIGGIVRERDLTRREGLPGIMNLPILGMLVSAKSRAKETDELLVFITPTIIKRPPLAP